MSDRRVAAIPVQECGEALVDARAHGLKVDDRKRDAAGAWSHVRQGVVARLLHAQSLLPPGPRHRVDTTSSAPSDSNLERALSELSSHQ